MLRCSKIHHMRIARVSSTSRRLPFLMIFDYIPKTSNYPGSVIISTSKAWPSPLFSLSLPVLCFCQTPDTSCFLFLGPTPAGGWGQCRVTRAPAAERIIKTQRSHNQASSIWLSHDKYQQEIIQGTDIWTVVRNNRIWPGIIRSTEAYFLYFALIVHYWQF